MSTALDAKLAQQMEHLSRHKLRVIADAPLVKVCRLQRDDSSELMVELSFTPYGITLFGDLYIAGTAPLGARFKNLPWFLGDLSPDYLAQKFLETRYVPALAKAHVQGMIEQMRRNPDDFDISPEEAERIEEQWDTGAGFDDEDEYGDTWADLLRDDRGDSHPGYGYDPSEVVLLSAVQRTFRREFHASVWGIKSVPGGTALALRQPLLPNVEGKANTP